MAPNNQIEEAQPLLVGQAPGPIARYGSSPDPEVDIAGCINIESNDDLSASRREENEVSRLKVITGIGLVIAAGFSFTASNIIQKFYVPTLTFWQLLLHRAIVQTVLLLGVCVIKGYNVGHGAADILLGPTGVRVRTVMQGMLGGVLLLCMFNAIKHIPLGNSSAIMFCTPVFTFIFAPCMLREHCGLFRSLIAVFMIMGVVLITRPPFFFSSDSLTPDNNSTAPDTNTTDPILPDFDGATPEVMILIGYFCAVGVPLLSAIISILTRQCKHVPAYLLMFWFGAGALIVSLFSITIFQPGHLFNLSQLEWISTASIIALGIFGNLCYTFAVRWVSPSKANVFRSFEVILNYALQLHFEHTKFYPENAIGIFLLVAALIIMAYEKEAYKKFNSRFI